MVEYSVFEADSESGPQFTFWPLGRRSVLRELGRVVADGHSTLELLGENYGRLVLVPYGQRHPVYLHADAAVEAAASGLYGKTLRWKATPASPRTNPDAVAVSPKMNTQSIGSWLEDFHVWGIEGEGQEPRYTFFPGVASPERYLGTIRCKHLGAISWLNLRSLLVAQKDGVLTSILMVDLAAAVAGARSGADPLLSWHVLGPAAEEKPACRDTVTTTYTAAPKEEVVGSIAVDLESATVTGTINGKPAEVIRHPSLAEVRCFIRVFAAAKDGLPAYEFWFDTDPASKGGVLAGKITMPFTPALDRPANRLCGMTAIEAIEAARKGTYGLRWIPDRLGDWVTTASGRRFYTTDPRPEDVFIEDVAHHLSRIPRFTGATRSPFDVAQHSLLVTLNVPERDRPAALLHDAGEFPLGDLATPTKKQPEFAGFREAEEKIRRAVFARYGLPPELPASVIEADRRAYATEALTLIDHRDPEWDAKLRGIDRFPEPLRVMTSEAAKTVFLKTFDHYFPGMRR